MSWSVSVQPDHVHLLLEIPPKYAVSKVVGDIKANTAREMRKEFQYLARSSEMWSVGYFVSTVGSNEKVIRDYIEMQEKQDTGRAELVLGEDITGGA
jgi:putative transposase